MTKEEAAVLKIIHQHRQVNKITDPEIRQQVTIADPENKKGAGLRKVINSLRKQGFAICSDTGGYWYAQSRQELLDNAGALRGRAIKILEAAKGMERAAENYEQAQARLIDIGRPTIDDLKKKLEEKRHEEFRNNNLK